MDRDEYYDILRVFKIICIGLGRDDYEDFAHSYMLKRLEGRGEKQRIRHFIIDELRSQFGRTGEDRQTVNSRLVNFDDVSNLDHGSVESSIADKIDIKRMLKNIKSAKQRLVASLYHLDDLGIRDIADHLKISESRVCQILKSSMLEMQCGLRDHTKSTEH